MKKYLLYYIISTFIFTLTAKEMSVKLTLTRQITLVTTNKKTLTINKTKAGLDIASFKGKPFFIILFGNKCAACISEIPKLNKLVLKYSKNINIIGIETQGLTNKLLTLFKKKYKLNYQVVAGLNHANFVKYLANRVGYPKVIPLPLLISFDKNAELQSADEGGLDIDDFESLIRKLSL